MIIAVRVGNELIRRTFATKYLSLIVDDTLKWDLYVDCISKKTKTILVSRDMLMSASSDRPGLFPELICGRYKIYSNKERYEYNNIEFLILCLGLLWECEVKALCLKLYYLGQIQSWLFSEK